MSEYSFAAAAAVGSYYHEAARGPGHAPGIHAFEDYINGITPYELLLCEVVAVEQDPGFRPPTFEEWAASPEAEAAIATRIDWQERYKTLDVPAKKAFYQAYGHMIKEGNFMEAVFFAKGKEQLVAKRPLQAEQAIGARRIEAAVSALVLQDEVHPTLEQIRGFSYDRGIVTVFKPGKPPVSMPPEELEVVKKGHMEFALEGLVAAARSGAKLDADGRNMVVDPKGNINFFDLQRIPHVDAGFLLGANFNGFLHMFNNAAELAPKPDAEKIRRHLHEQGLKLIHAIDPDFVYDDGY